MSASTKKFILIAGAWIQAAMLACGSLIIDPLRTFHSVAPGEELHGSITLKNPESSTAQFEIQFRDITSKALRDAFPDWIDFEKTLVTLAPNESKAIPYTVRVPEEATGEFAGRVSFMTPRNSKKGMVKIRSSIAVSIYVKVKGTERYDIEVKVLQIKPNTPLEADIVLLNRGNVHVRPLAKCRIIPEGASTPILSFSANEDRYPIYPGEERSFAGRLETPLAPGLYTARIELSDKQGMSYPIEKELLLFVEAEIR